MRQFSLRNLLLFTAVVAMVLAWLLPWRPRRAGFEVQVRNGRAYVVDAVTGRVWDRSNLENGSAMGELEEK